MQTTNTVENIILTTQNDLKNEEWKDTGNQKEQWSEVGGYEGLYSISTTGKIKRLKNSYIRKKCFNNKLSKSHITKNSKSAYYRISLCNKDGKYKQWLIHRLVALTFIPNPNNLPCINHKDSDKTNNNVDNLEWTTYKQNSQHAVKNGKFISGENHHTTHLNKDKVDLIRLMYLSGNKENKEICELYSITTSTFACIINNTTWKDSNYELLLNSKLFQKRKWLNQNRGISNCNSKLNDEKVKTIREIYEHWDYSSLKLARLFDVNKKTILGIVNKHTWKHI